MTERVTGFVAPGFEAVRDAFEANFAEDLELGAGVALIRDGETLVDLQGGWADRKKTTPWDARTLVPIYSTTKGIAALVLAAAVDQLELGYETRVADVWPEFGVEGKERVTIAELTSHQAGLPGFVDEIDPGLWLDPPACAAAIAAEAPIWPPGSAHGYHPLTWGYLVGEIFHRVMDVSLGKWLRETLCLPHDIDFHIGLPVREHDRCAEIMRPRALAELGEVTPARRAAFLTKWAAPDRGGAIWREIEIPSANGHGTALSVARLYHLYARPDEDVMRSATHRALVAPRYPASPDLVLPMDTSFGAGIMLNSHGFFGPNEDALGHCGWGGSLAMADPDLGVSFAYVMNRQSNVLVGDARAVRLVTAAYACL